MRPGLGDSEEGGTGCTVTLPRLAREPRLRKERSFQPGRAGPRLGPEGTFLPTPAQGSKPPMNASRRPPMGDWSMPVPKSTSAIREPATAHTPVVACDETK